MSSLCVLGERSGEDASLGKLPRRSCGSVPLLFGQSPTSRLAQGWDLPLRLGRSFLTLRLNWAPVESTASCSREARLPLRHCRQLQRSSPFLSWFGRQQLAPRSCRCHRPTVIRESCHACQSTHVARSVAGDFRDLQVTTVHPASLNASRNPSGELIKPESLPRYPSWSVSSSSSVLQPSSLVSSPSGASCSRSLTHPSLGHDLAVCQMPLRT